MCYQHYNYKSQNHSNIPDTGKKSNSALAENKILFEVAEEKTQLPDNISEMSGFCFIVAVLLLVPEEEKDVK